MNTLVYYTSALMTLKNFHNIGVRSLRTPFRLTGWLTYGNYLDVLYRIFYVSYFLSEIDNMITILYSIRDNIQKTLFSS